MPVSKLVQTVSGPLGRQIFRGLMKDRSSVFMLHRLENQQLGVRGHSAEFVKSALTALRGSGAEFVPLRTMVERWQSGKPADPNWIAFTIDDGFADQAELIKAVFLPMKCPVTVFLITGFLDGKLWPWDDQLVYAFHGTPLVRASIALPGKHFEFDLSSASQRRDARVQVRDYCKTLPHAGVYEHIRSIATALKVEIPSQPPEGFRAMSWDQVRELERLGVDFGPHSNTHRIFSRLSPEETRNEVATSWSRLRAELRNPVPIFAWPTGRTSDFESKDIEIAKQEGLIASVATNDNYAHVGAHDPTDLYRIKRFSLPYDITTVLRYGSWLERARQLLMA